MRRQLFSTIVSCLLCGGCMPRPQVTTNREAPPAVLAMPEPAMPGPYRQRLGAAVTLNATCVSCHEDEAAEWRGSLHHRAYENAAFQAALAVEPAPFCRGCHAPESDPGRAPDGAVGELGVGCVTCHVTGDGVVLAAASSTKTAPSSPHPVRRSVELARTGGCAGCHEFGFPSARRDDDDPHLMQTTVREHRRSPAAGGSCGACHMTLVQGRRSHAFAEVRDPSWLKERLRVKAEIASGDRARLTLVQSAPGHAFPTGDLFRRLEVGCELRAAGGQVLRREVRHLARHFEVLPGVPGRHLTADDRVFDTPMVVELPLIPPAESSASARYGSVVWWVTYQRVAGVGTGTNLADATIESEVKLHSGVLPWEAK